MIKTSLKFSMKTVFIEGLIDIQAFEQTPTKMGDRVPSDTHRYLG